MPSTVDVVTIVRVTHVREVEICAELTWSPLVTPQTVFQEGVRTVSTANPSNVHHGRKIIMQDADEGCVPIDGGLGFLIAGGLGMGVLGVRRRKELELEA